MELYEVYYALFGVCGFFALMGFAPIYLFPLVFYSFESDYGEREGSKDADAFLKFCVVVFLVFGGLCYLFGQLYSSAYAEYRKEHANCVQKG